MFQKVDCHFCGDEGQGLTVPATASFNVAVSEVNCCVTCLSYFLTEAYAVMEEEMNA